VEEYLAIFVLTFPLLDAITDCFPFVAAQVFVPVPLLELAGVLCLAVVASTQLCRKVVREGNATNLPLNLYLVFIWPMT
jgi:hypothetical protein